MNANAVPIPATKKDVEEAVEKVAEAVREGFAHNDKRFSAIEDILVKMDERIGKIENLLIEDHRQRIQRLEEKVKKLEDALAV